MYEVKSDSGEVLRGLWSDANDAARTAKTWSARHLGKWSVVKGGKAFRHL